jgi:sugar/nucleoside kinase (ribokinase family)
VRLPIEILPIAARSFDVVGLGQNSVDLLALLREFPTGNSKHRIERFVRLPGGQVASAMVCCARLGWRARYLGRFGSDELGTIGRESLTSEGVDVSAAEVIDGAHTRFAMILVDGRTGERTVLWDRDARLALPQDAVPRDAVESARVLLVDCDDMEASIEAAGIARANGIVTVIDVETLLPGLDALLPLIDVVIASEGFPEQFTGIAETGDALRRLERDLSPALVCVTLGPLGSLARCGGREIRTNGFRVPVVDSTGAGDAFRGGFIAAMLRSGGEDVEELLRSANAVAALKCRAAGAREGLPRPEELDTLLAGTLDASPKGASLRVSP